MRFDQDAIKNLLGQSKKTTEKHLAIANKDRNNYDTNVLFNRKTGKPIRKKLQEGIDRDPN